MVSYFMKLIVRMTEAPAMMRKMIAVMIPL